MDIMLTLLKNRIQLGILIIEYTDHNGQVIQKFSENFYRQSKQEVETITKQYKLQCITWYYLINRMA
jgi:hypothetical protein